MADKHEAKDKKVVEPKEQQTTTVAHHNFRDNLLDELAKEVGRATATGVMGSLSPETKVFLRKHANWLRFLRIARFFIPNHVAGEAVQEFAEKFHDQVREETHQEAKATVETVQVAAEQINVSVKVLMATDELDPALRQDFEEWYLSDNDHRAGFNKLAADLDADRIKKFAVRPKGELERIITQFKEQRPLDYPGLRKLINDDTALLNRVNAFLGRINVLGVDRTQEFWAAVQKRAMKSFEEFKSLMNMGDADILNFLQMRPETTEQTAKRFDSKIEELARKGHRRLDALDRLDRQKVRKGTWFHGTDWARRPVKFLLRPITAVLEGLNFKPF